VTKGLTTIKLKNKLSLDRPHNKDPQTIASDPTQAREPIINPGVKVNQHHSAKGLNYNESKERVMPGRAKPQLINKNYTLRH
jgi:hypothetical protein